MASLAKFWSSLARWQKNTLVASCVLTVYALIGFTLLPRILHHVLVTNVAEALHRPVSVEEIRCNPLTLTIDVRNLRVTEQNGTNEFVALDGLHADIELSSVWRLAIVLKDIRLDGPRLHIRLDEDGQTNFADLTAATPEDSAEKPASPVLVPLIVEPFRIANGTVVLEDGIRKTTHVVDQIDFRVPRFSSRKKDWETFMTPSLAFRVNGAPFSLQGRTIPFHDSLKTQFELNVVDLSLPQYWTYVPAAKDLKLTKGTLTLHNTLVFEQHEDALPTLSLRGSVSGQDIELTEHNDVVFAAPRTEVILDDISVLNLRLGFKSVTLDSPFLRVVRRQDGTLNWPGYFGVTHPSSAVNATDAANATDTVVLLLAPEAKITNGRVAFRDETLPTPFVKELQNINVTVTDLSTAANATSQANLRLESTHGEKIEVATAFSLSPLTLTGSLKAQNLNVPSYAPYFKDALPLALTSAAIDVQASLALPERGMPRVTDAAVTVRDLNLKAADNAGGLQARRIALDKIDVDLAKHAVSTGQLTIEDARLTTAVGARGRAKILDALKKTPTQRSKPKDASSPASKPAVNGSNGGNGSGGQNKAWTVQSAGAQITDLAVSTMNGTTPIALQKLNISKLSVNTGARTATVGNVDLSLALDIALQKNGDLNLATLFASTTAEKNPPAKSTSKDAGNNAAWQAGIDQFSISESTLAFTDESSPKPMRLDVDHIALRTTNLSTDFSKAIPLDFSCRVGKSGTIAASGSLAPAVMTGKGDLKIAMLPLSVASAYAAHAVDIDIPAGHLNGDLDWSLGAKGAGRITGNLKLEGLRVTEGRGKAEIAGVRSLDLRDIAVQISPLAVRIGSVDIIDPKGGFVIDTKGKTTLDRIAPAMARPDPTKPKDSRGSASGQGGLASLDIGTITLKNGRFSFADKTLSPRFESVIAPVELTVSGFSLDPSKRSELNLSTTIDGLAPITVTGWVSPLQNPPAANSTITLRDLNMTALSPYSAKFIAYPITSGQLDWDMHIGTQASSLAMGNSITARQLELGDKVESPDAADVPVKLGLALLRDMSGNIAINLPVQGDLNDPKFSIGGIVMQAFLGLIVKAIASPFSLLASIVPNGANQDMSKLAFPPGLAAPTPETVKTMERLAKIMAQRPGLSIAVNGRAAMEADREGLEDVLFRRKLKSVKYEDMPRRERKQIALDDVQITDGEYADLLWEAYKNEPVEKEKNAIGMHKKVPLEVQEAKLREQIRVTDEDLIRLAASRAEFVRNYLVSELKVDASRVILGQAGPQALSSAPEVALEVRQ